MPSSDHPDLERLLDSHTEPALLRVEHVQIAHRVRERVAVRERARGGVHLRHAGRSKAVAVGDHGAAYHFAADVTAGARIAKLVEPPFRAVSFDDSGGAGQEFGGACAFVAEQRMPSGLQLIHIGECVSGYGVGHDRDGVRPALHLNLSSSNLYSYAGTVCSDAMKSGESGTDNPVKPSEPDESDTPNQPAHPDKPGTATGTRTEESDVDIEIDGGVDFTIPENVPILGGGDVSLDYGTIPVTFKREDNTYRIGIGVQDMNKKDWTTFKKFVETQKESYRKGINSLLATKSGIASMGMSVEPEMKAYGYVEGTITKANGVESAGGKLVVEIKGTAKQEWQTVVVVVPVVIKVKGTAGTKADFSVGFDFNKSKVYTKGEVELTLPSVRLTGGIGVSYIADISVYGEAKNLVTVESDGKDNDITASLEGALGVSAKALCFSYEKELLNGSFDYLSTKKKSKARMYARALPKLEPEAKDYEIQRVDSSSWDGSAVVEQTAKPRSIKRAASAKNISGRVTTLLSDVYASAKPQLLQTASGKKLLIFTTDMGDRTTGNHTAVVYSIYNERGWSIPKLIDDDGTADFDAVAAVDGENVYVTWINAKRTFTPEEAEAEDFMTKLAAETEVQATKIALNGNTGTVTKYPAITDNAIADLHPSITVKNHVPYIAWNSNSANDILKGTGTNTVYLASLNGNAFTTKKLSEENKPVQSVAIGNLDNDVVTAYTLNSGTEENPQVQLTTVNAKGRTTIAANGQNLSPSFAKIDGSSVLLWYAQDAEGSSLNYIDAIDGAVESYIEDDAVISADYTVVDGGDSQLLICSSEKENAEETGRNLYAYVIRDGEVYEPVTLTDLEGYAAVPSGIWNGTAYEYLFTRTDVDITENTVTENTDLCITSVVPQSKLVIGDIDYTQAVTDENGNIDQKMLNAIQDGDTVTKIGRKDSVKEDAEKMLDRLQSTMRMKAKAMCDANGVEFDLTVFNTMFNNAKSSAVAGSIETKKALFLSITTINPQNLIKTFTTNFKDSYTVWVNAEAADVKNKK